MPRVTCPRCSCKPRVPQFILQATICCPGCSHVFQASFPAHGRPGRQPPAETDEGPPPRPAPLLTAGHACQHCHSLLGSATGLTRATVVCPACDNKTSVYAVLHTCPTCHRLLESPARSAGSETTCPNCKRPLRVPKDVLLPEPPASPGEFWFGFYCPSCSGEVATREGDVGTYAVCPHCLVPLVVPHWGHYLEGAAPVPPHDPLDSLRASREVGCPACQARFPARSPACPVCGTRLASP